MEDWVFCVNNMHLVILIYLLGTLIPLVKLGDYWLLLYDLIHSHQPAWIFRSHGTLRLVWLLQLLFFLTTIFYGRVLQCLSREGSFHFIEGIDKDLLLLPHKFILLSDALKTVVYFRIQFFFQLRFCSHVLLTPTIFISTFTCLLPLKRIIRLIVLLFFLIKNRLDIIGILRRLFVNLRSRVFRRHLIYRLWSHGALTIHRNIH